VRGWLIDTNVLSELRRARPEAGVVEFIAAQRLDALFVSVVTFAEIRFGIERTTDVTRRTDLNDWLASILRPMFAQRTLPVSEDVMLRWRLLVEVGRKARHTYSQPDLIIAATALHYGLTVATRDTREFEKAGAAVFNPWRKGETAGTGAG
jgi:toxin FitB